ncbi:hypothetical protein ACSBR2_040309 [Camellia fascicularis]
MSMNDMQISNSLGSLKSLRYLDLSWSIFNATIPHHLGNLSRLQYLNLSNNYLRGPIRDTLGRLTSLTVLDLSINDFDDSMLYSLCNLSSLVHIDLSITSHKGAIPHCLGNLASLSILRLSANYLQGLIPKLDLSLNVFEGAIPHCLGNLASLSILRLSANYLQGPIPSEMGNMTQLTELDLSLNVFEGAIPHCLGNLASLSILRLSANYLQGPIPISLGQLSKLEYLDLSNNAFVSTIFELHFAKLKSLNELYLHSNSLVLNVTSQWVPPFQLQVIQLSSIKVGPQFPQWLETQKNVTQLDMSNASILDVIPDWFESIYCGIIYLDLSNNEIKGKVPIFQKCKYRYSAHDKWLLLSSNRFEGPLTPLPSHVYSLDLFNNLLSGPITVSDDNAKSITVIDFSNNQLSGKIPPCLGQLDQLSVLDLTNNSLYGEVPSSLGSLQSLTSLHLRNNKFHGKLPLSLQNLTSLFIIDLDHGYPTGTEPDYYYEENILDSMKGRELEYTRTLQFLISMDLSNNGIVGEIPEELMDLSGLLNLNLSGNHLKGRIPNNIGNLTQLESLDLSRNKLFGPIPPSLSSLSYLGHLNMSFNNLSGRIPTGNQLRTLDDPSIYIGNDDGLCGAPLNSCLNDKSSDGDHKHVDESEVADETDFLWFYTGIGPGFLFGLLGACGTLNFKKSWRYAYFQFIENSYNWISVTIAIKFTQLRRKFNNGKFGR